jgi:CelD/BcsL family acetyltransferase involved in cellulose biosynthesis
VATQLAVEYSNRFWLLKIGYDESLARCSPGSLLMLHTLGDAAARGLTGYEFLGSEAPWTAIWTSEVLATTVVGAYPPRLPAGAALAADAAEVARAYALRRIRR